MIKLSWPPHTAENIAAYTVERATLHTGPWAVLATVVHDLTGPDYDGTANVFVYTDEDGTETHWYRLSSVDTDGYSSLPSQPFQALTVPPAFPATVKVDHNYGGPGALRYVASGGTGVEGALIRIYRKSDFDQGHTDAPFAITRTNAQGNWVDPIHVHAGYTYVVQFHKEGLFGPNSVEVVA
jgi:hypothetical protein